MNQNSAVSAYPLKIGQAEVGVFAPYRRAVAEGLDCSVYPISFLVVPNAACKKAWLQHQSLGLATRHRLLYPTPLLRGLRGEGSGRILAHEERVGHLLSSYHGVLLSLDFDPSWRATLELGLRHSLGPGASKLASIDLPWVFPRTNDHLGRATPSLMTTVEGDLTRGFSLEVSAQYFALSIAGRNAVHTEIAGHIRYHLSQVLTFRLGMVRSTGRYPFGLAAYNLPLLDFVWRFETKAS